MPTELHHHLVRSDEDVLALAKRVAAAGPDAIVAHDTETGASPEGIAAFGPDAALYPYAGAYCTGMSVCVVERDQETGVWGAEGLHGFYVPVGHRVGNASQRATAGLCEALGATAGLHALHHATFDWDILENLDNGYRVRPFVDTQVLRWLQDENQPKGLKTLGEIYLGEDASKEKRELAEAMGSCWENQTQAYKAVRCAYPELPVGTARAMARRMRAKRTWGEVTVQEMAPYAARDATMTAQVLDALTGYEGAFNPSPAYARELELQPILHHMDRKGVSVELAQLERAGVVYGERADVIGAEMEEAYGAKMRGWFGRKESTKLNLNSPDQVAWLLFEEHGIPVRVRTDTGAPSTSKAALEMLEGLPIAKQVLEYRKWSHAQSSYATLFAKFAELSPDGRIHGHYSSTRTVTGRLSASGPNVMTIPRDNTLPEIRKAFYKVPPGIQRIGFDLKSAELWVTASLTKDPRLTQTLLEGGNMHLDMMQEVFGGERDKERAEYTIAKNVNYSMAYEAGLQPLMMYAAKGGFPPDEVERIAWRLLNGHKKLYGKMHRTSEWLTEKARELGQLPLHVDGRYRHFRSPGVAVQYYTALNALVQGGIAEFMKDVMLELFRDPRGFGEWLVLQVHDELVFDAPDEPGIRDELLATLNAISERINPFRFVLGWDAKGWSDAEAA